MMPMKNLISGLLLISFVSLGTVYGKPASKDSVNSINAFELNRIEFTGDIVFEFNKNDVRAGAFFGSNFHGKYFEFSNVKTLPFYYLSYNIGLATTFRNLIFDFSFGPEVIVSNYVFFRLSAGYWEILVNKTDREFGFNLSGEGGLIVPLSKKIGLKFGTTLRYFTNKFNYPWLMFSVGLVF